jgi:hypothetical protein
MDALDFCRGVGAELIKRGLVGLDVTPKPPSIGPVSVLPPPFKIVIASSVGYFCLRRWGLMTAYAILAPLFFLLESIHDFSHLKFEEEVGDR